MKNIIAVLMLLVVIQYSLYGQWEEKSIGTNSTLTSVSFVDENIGFVTSVIGVIYKTIDGGTNWEVSFETSGTVFLEDVFAIDEDNVVAVGKDVDTQETVVVRTENAGLNWNTISIGSTGFLSSVFFTGNEIGYSCGGNGKMFKTNNGGVTWHQQNTPTDYFLQSVFFINEMIGFAVGGIPSASVVLKTIDGGNTWNEIDVPSVNFLQSVFMIDNQIGFVVGWNGEILKTENCGTSWIEQTSVEMSGNLEVFFTNTSTGYIVGGGFDTGSIQRTTNGGNDWNGNEFDIQDDLVSIFFPTFDTGYAVGGDGTVLKTTSGGVTSNRTVNSLIKMNCYPNPVTDLLTIEIGNNEMIEVVKLFDNGGHLIFSKATSSSKVEIDFSNFESNYYYLLIESKGEKITKKIAKF